MQRKIGLAALVIVILSGCATTQNQSKLDAAEQGGKSSRLLRLAADIEKQGDTGTAIALYEQAASAQDASAQTFVELGDAYMRAGYPDQAIQSYKAALSRSPNYGPALVGLGWVMVNEGDTEAGLRTLAEGTRSVNTVEAYNRLGVAQTFAGQIEPALATFQQALSLAPNDLDIQINMAIAMALANDASRALPLARKVATSPSASLHHKRNAILVYGLLGQAGEARALSLAGLSTTEVNELLAQAKSFRAKPTVLARAQALGSAGG
ncbi:Flp pilus assembly protein TadD [Mesorhizobium sp. J18]|uniref:tetratricopeptide repeat protein n=1 Tax=Mesorhizobium sp. J18 TaxID=935263 RepID=UPI00119A07AE|nr:tetratricopeptide repeat protein [Mesorhizobium sp. J18]TWH00092.1 Flp pilus assembly protein TadD [Mesorhizobium sp. J18]